MKSKQWRKARLVLRTVASILSIAIVLIQATKFLKLGWDWTLAIVSVLIASSVISLYLFERKIHQQELSDLNDKMCELRSKCPRNIPPYKISQELLEVLYSELHRILQVSSAKRTPYQTVETYMKRADELREEEASSIHVLYATYKAIFDFYSMGHWTWVDNELAYNKENSDRRRLLILDETAINDKEYLKSVKRIHDIFKQTGQIEAVGDVFLIEREPRLLRDFGIFQASATGLLHGLMPHSPVNTKDIFSMVPGCHYEITDQGYLEETFALFNKFMIGDRGIKSEFKRCKNIIKSVNDQ